MKKPRKVDTYRAARRNAVRTKGNIQHWRELRLWDLANENARRIKREKSISA